MARTASYVARRLARSYETGSAEQDELRYLPTFNEELQNAFLSLLHFRETNDLATCRKKFERLLLWRTQRPDERDYDDDQMRQYVERILREAKFGDAEPRERELCRKFIELLCERDDPFGLKTKADLLDVGALDYERDVKKARSIYLKLAQAPSTSESTTTLKEVARALGRNFSHTPGAKSENALETFHYYSIGAALGDVDCRLGQARAFFGGVGVPKSPDSAQRLALTLYERTRDEFLLGSEEARFAEVASLLGELALESRSFDDAYRYFLQADFALRVRSRLGAFADEPSLSRTVARGLKESLKNSSYKRREELLKNVPFGDILKYVYFPGRMYELTKEPFGADKAYFILRPYSSSWKAPRAKMLLTCPETRFCGFVESIELLKKGLEFEKDELPFVSAVSFDEFKDGKDFFMKGKKVAGFDSFSEVRMNFLSKSTSKKATFISVHFKDSDVLYDYLCDIPDVESGDVVMVVARNKYVRVRVVAQFEMDDYETFLPWSEYKHIRGKVLGLS